jgi:energy-converting hydrogenase Eha subunit A
MAILVRMRKIDYCQMLVVVTMIIVYVTKIIHSTVVMFFLQEAKMILMMKIFKSSWKRSLNFGIVQSNVNERTYSA